MSPVVKQNTTEAIRNLLGDADVNEKLVAMFRGGPATSGRINLKHFTPFQERVALGESQPFREGQFSLKDFIQEVNKQLEEPVTK